MLAVYVAYVLFVIQTHRVITGQTARLMDPARERRKAEGDVIVASALAGADQAEHVFSNRGAQVKHGMDMNEHSDEQQVRPWDFCYL